MRDQLAWNWIDAMLWIGVILLVVRAVAH